MGHYGEALFQKGFRNKGLKLFCSRIWLTGPFHEIVDFFQRLNFSMKMFENIINLWRYKNSHVTSNGYGHVVCYICKMFDYLPSKYHLDNTALLIQTSTSCIKCIKKTLSN